jgi:hypothetical protein
MKANLLKDTSKLSSDDSISPELLTEMELRDAEYEANPKSGCTIEQFEVRELDRRLDLMRKNPNRAVPWTKAKRRILKRRENTK